VRPRNIGIYAESISTVLVMSDPGPSHLSWVLGIRVFVRGSKNTRAAQWSLKVWDPNEWLVAKLVTGEAGAEGARGGMSTNDPDDVGECGDRWEGRGRSYDLRLRGLRSLTGLLGAVLLLLEDDGELTDNVPNWIARGLWLSCWASSSVNASRSRDMCKAS
jgi:hypothetical protein